MPRDRQNVAAAVGWMLCSAVGSTAFAVIGRMAAKHMPLTDLVLLRSAFALPIVCAAILWTGGGFGQLKTTRFGLHLTRNVIHFIAQYLWLYAVTVVPLAVVFAIEFTTPLWIMLFGPILLAERLTAARLTAAVVGFAGVLVIVRPGVTPIDQGTAAALAAAAALALSVVAIKRLTATESPLRILFYMTVIHTVLAFVMLGGRIPVPSPTGAGLAALFAFAGLFVHYCMSRAYALGDALLVTPVDFVRLPLIAVVGAVLYGERLDGLFVLGAALIVSANWWNVRSMARRPSSAEATTETADVRK